MDGACDGASRGGEEQQWQAQRGKRGQGRGEGASGAGRAFVRGRAAAQEDEEGRCVRD